MSDPISSRTFHLLSVGTPGQIWDALTSSELSPRFLHGLTVRGIWSTGGALELTCSHGITLHGRVLFSQRPDKLSWTIEDGGCTYLTWELRESPAGTVVRLTVEEPDSCASDDQEFEDAWLPALRALEAVLSG